MRSVLLDTLGHCGALNGSGPIGTRLNTDGSPVDETVWGGLRGVTLEKVYHWVWNLIF